MQYNQDGVEPFFAINEHCLDDTTKGQRDCAYRHTAEYELCAERPTPDGRNRTEFCYYNGGNNNHKKLGDSADGDRFALNDDALIFNKHERMLPRKSKDWLTVTGKGVQPLCEPVCSTDYGWNMPVMPLEKGKHGVVESRHQLMTNIKDFPVQYGGGGEYPPDALKHSAEAVSQDQEWSHSPAFASSSEELLMIWPSDGGRPQAKHGDGKGHSNFPRPPWNKQSGMDKVEPRLDSDFSTPAHPSRPRKSRPRIVRP
ncbi:MAG: hypothetical protein Q9218_001510 [Villophora microphyllina]